MSQITSHGQCAMRYWIERRKGVREVPAWWNVAGTAFHETIREHETLAAIGPRTPTADEAAKRFPHFLAEQIAQTVIDTGVGPHDWRAGGRKSEAYPNKEDRSWWLDKGPEMVAQYVVAQEGRGCEVLRMPDTSPEPIGDALALELGFMWDPGHGLPPVKGFIDQVLYFPASDGIIVRDLKSGSQVPVDRLQVAVYRLALEDCFGVTATRWWGDFWQARKGKESTGWDLSDRAKVEAFVHNRLRVMDAAERLGIYPANPGNNCSSCGVRPHCPAMSDEPFATWPPALDASITG